MGPFGEVLLLDWGLAKVWHPEELEQDAGGAIADGLATTDPSLTDHSQLQGTVSYMSPEQIRDDPAIDHRTDIYSLGSVLYEVLAGTPPVSGDTVDEIFNQTLHANIVPPSQCAKDPVPPRLEEICMHCLRLAPDERLQTAHMLIRELQEDW